MSISVKRFALLIAFSAIIFTAAAGSAAAQSPDRGGFTLVVDLGAGIQNDTALDETGKGLAGLNFGAGGFLTPNMAIMGRISGTNASYETPFGDVRQTSGVVAPVVQYWTSDKVYVQGGAGVGYGTSRASRTRGWA